MQKWMNRFTLLAVLGGLLASALVVGCGGGEEETPAQDANSTANGTSTP